MFNGVRIIIPSYKRPNTIRTKTLAALKSYNVPPGCITVFVADTDEERVYRNALTAEDCGDIIVGCPGLAEVRNYILSYYPRGAKIVMIDDDVQGFVQRTETGGVQRLQCLGTVIQRGFQEAETAGCTLWGVAPVPNGFFLRDTVTTDLKFCIGSFWGIVNPGSGPDGIHLPMSDKEDYIRTLLAFKRDGKVVRMNYVSVKSAYYTEPGGMQTDPQRLAKQEEAVRYLLETFPGMVRRNTRRKSHYPEVLLKRLR